MLVGFYIIHKNRDDIDKKESDEFDLNDKEKKEQIFKWSACENVTINNRSSVPGLLLTCKKSARMCITKENK